MKSPLLRICHSVWRPWCWGFQAVKCGFEAADVGSKYGFEAVDVGSKVCFCNQMQVWWFSHCNILKSDDFSVKLYGN